MKRILVVDDSFGVRCVTKEFFRCFFPKYVVEEAVDGLQALEKLGVGGFDLVISDIEMPRMNGLELAKRIKQRFPQLPIIFLSGTLEKHEEEILVLEVSGYLSKPFDLKELKLCIQRVLGD